MDTEGKRELGALVEFDCEWAASCAVDACQLAQAEWGLVGDA